MPQNPVATIEVAGFGTMKVELYPEFAPNTVHNFIDLAQKEYYDGLIFHRIIKDFMIQGGGSQTPSCAIKGEFTKNGVNNPLKHERGVISMARTSVMDSATSQFFIVHKTSSHLDGSYAGFGKVIEGYDVLDRIAIVQTSVGDRPVQNVVITSIRVETFGHTYPKAVCVK